MRTLWNVFTGIVDFMASIFWIAAVVLFIAGRLHISCGATPTGSMYTCTLIEKFWN